MNNEFYINAIEENLFNISLIMGNLKGGSSYNGEDIKWTYTGGLSTNRVFPRRMDEKNIDEKLSDILSKFKAWNAPFDLFLCPPTYPEKMERYLNAHGLVYSRKWAGMAFTLDGYWPEVKENPDIKIVKVEDTETIRIWSKIGGASFGVPQKSLGDMENLYVKLGSKCDIDLFYYMGLRNGIPVATTCLFKDGNVAGLYMVGTLPEARGEGIAMEMVMHALKEAITMGCSLVILHASDMGRVVYEKIGFKEYCTIDIYKIKNN